MLTKEECKEALGNLYFASYNPHREEELTQTLKENMHTLDNLIEEHFDNKATEFDNPPLKFEELKEKMWVWDNDRIVKGYYQIYSLNHKEKTVNFTSWHIGSLKFEENRFYRRQVIQDD